MRSSSVPSTIKDIIHDFDSRQFVDASTGDRRSRDDLRNLYAGLGAGAETRYRGGGATLARAAVLNTLVRGQGTEAWRGVLAAVSDQLRGRGLGARRRACLDQYRQR
ncbi:protein of unknown function [Thauera humireducens]|nr:protein of unknown function [Thauera humireducens]